MTKPSLTAESNYMFRSYLKTAWRFLSKNKTFTLINIFGLAMGTLCCLYILLYVRDQYSFDKHHRDTERIFRLVKTEKSPDGMHRLAISGGFMAPALKKDFPEVEQFTRIVPFLGVEKHLLRYKEKSVYEKNAFYVDSTFFDVFTYHFVYGDRNSLMKPFTVALLRSTAEKLFGNSDPSGKVITIDNTHGKQDYTVMAVVDESLGKSHLKANIFITMNSGGLGDYINHTDSWTNNNFIGSYVKLRKNANPAGLEKKLPAFVNRYAGKELRNAGLEQTYFLQPVTAIHTTTGFDNPGIGKPVSPVFLTILATIALLIQVVACINFMNLSTARASKRAKEVGVRKVIGAGRRDLIRQFLGESFLLCALSVVAAVVLLFFLLPYLNQLTATDIPVSQLRDPKVWILLALLGAVTGWLAGSYPAFYLSAFRVVNVLKGNFTSHISATGIRRSLVVFQFVISIVLVTGIIIMYSQLRYIKNKDLGYDQDQRLVFTFNSGDSFDKIPSFMEDLRQIPGVLEVSNASKSLGSPALFSNVFTLPGRNRSKARFASFIVADENFVKANGIKIISGRDFSSADSARVLVNETFLKNIGLDSRHAPGAKLTDAQSRVWEIAGVMKDFNAGTLHREIEPFMLWINNKKDGLWGSLTVHSSTKSYRELLSRIESVWKKDIPGVPFEYAFLDEQVQKMYESDQTMTRIINAFTGIAILISCLGLFGLAAFSAEQRHKEIGIRKVLGASVPGVIVLLSGDFLKLVGIAFLIATPLSWWAMNRWLMDFAYHIPLSWWMFGLGGLTTTFIALATVSSQAFCAATVNPVRTLRSE